MDLIYKEVGDEPAVLFFDNQEACEIITEAFKKYAAKLKTLAYSGDYHGKCFIFELRRFCMRFVSSGRTSKDCQVLDRR